MESGLNEELRMEAYFYGFEPTGVREVDVILSAVASAGKAAHHTEDWGEEVKGPTRYGPFSGGNPVEWIQIAANEAAAAFRALPPSSAPLLEALELAMTWIDNWQPNFTEDDEWPADRDTIRAALAAAKVQQP